MHIPIQTFSWFDILLIFLLFFLELLLSSDNAAVLAFIVRDLPSKKQKKALFLGLTSAFILRGIGIVFVAFLIKIIWVQIIGGLYLLFLGIKHAARFRFKKKNLHTEKRSFFKTVLLVEFTDLIFAIDSILAAFAFVAIYYPLDMLYEKIWVIYVGGILGVVFIRFATTSVVKLLYAYPNLEKIVYFLISWIGLKLIVEGILSYIGDKNVQEIFDLIFWIGSVLIVFIGFISTKWHKKV